MLQIHLFGHCRLFVDQQPHRLMALPKTTPLLAYLLLHRHTAVPRDHLAFLLWDDVPESEARANLRRHLHDLRRALPQNTDWVLSDTKMVQWNAATPYWLDLAEFERLCQDEQRLAEAVTLYTGDLLPDLYDDWLTAERERYQTLYAAAMIRLMERERRRGDLPQAMMVARQLLRHDSLREDVVRSLMQMRHESGDRAGAMQLYQQFKERLTEELGVPPMPETTALYTAITANTLVTPSPPNASIAYPTSSSSPPHNLPARLTRFIGREEEVNQICRLISVATAVTRLLTITGPGGTGKTRLALETAAWLWQNQPEQFPDGLFFVGLAAVANPDHVVTAVAETVGVHETVGCTLLQNLSDQLRPKRLLLVLDNFEHLLDAAPLVSDLLTAVPGLVVIVTSQAVLHLYGEYEFPLSPLPLADLEHLPSPAELLKVAAITLFVERLQAARHDFKLTEANARSVAEICTCLDGIPLALELAAARGKLFTPEAMMAQLHSRLHFLSGQVRNLPTRHQTLRATLDWSYHLLNETEQMFFATLSLFAASFTFTAVTSLFNPDLLENSLWQRRGEAEEAGKTSVPTFEFTEHHSVTSFIGLNKQVVAELLASLVDKNILRQLSDDADESRFRMLQTLREYGLEKLGQMETAVQLRLHQQFAAVYVVWTEQAEQGLRSGDQSGWLNRLRQEDANIMAAQEWLFAHADEPSGAQSGTNGLLAARLVATQDRYWSLQGRFNEARRWFTQALNYRHLLPADEQVKLINKAGVIAQHQGDYMAAAILHESALNQARQEENPELIANTLHFLGFAAGRQGRYEEARVLLEESLALYQELPDMLPQSTTALNNLAIVLRRLEAYDEAIAILEKALALKRQLNDQLGIPAVLGNLSQLSAYKGNFAQALAYGKESLALRQQLQDKPGLLVSLSQMADLAIETGQDGRGIRLLAASLTHRQRMNLALTAHVQAETEAEIANLRARLGDDAFAADWAVGAAMTVDEAVAYALAGEV